MKVKIGMVMFMLGIFLLVCGEVYAQETKGIAVSETVAVTSVGTTVAEVAKRGAIINMVKGEIYIMKSGEEKWIPAQVKMELFAGDKISSKKKAKAEILLDDGTIIKLKENTTLEIQELGEEVETKTKKSLFKMLLGKLWAKVIPASAGKFKIVTPVSIVGVRGTEFALSVYEDNSSEVLVFDGEIEIMGQEGMWTTLIPAGQALRTTSTGGQQPLREIKPEENKEWKDFVEGKEEEAEEEKEKKKKEEERPKEEEKIKVAEGPQNWTIDSGIGAINLNGVMYYRVTLKPVFKIGKFKAALNLNITWNDTEGFRKWEKEDWGNLILYLQWAEKGEKPVYARLGSIEAATLGQGFIVNRYSNMTPRAYNRGVHNLGIKFDLDTGKFGFESLLNNVLEPSLIGIRLFGRPFSGPFFENFTIGVTCAGDINTGPRNISATPAQETNTLIAGADMGLPILGKFLGWFADFGWIINHGNGWASGFKGGVGPVLWRFEYRNLASDFIPGYFNNYYEFNKPITISAPTGQRSNGWYGELTANILNFISLSVNYEDARDNAGISKLGYPWIHSLLLLNTDLFIKLFRQRISASLSYDQRNLCLPTTTQTTIWEGKLLYGISKNVDMIYVYTQRYTLDGKPVRTSSLQTQIHF